MLSETFVSSILFEQLTLSGAGVIEEHSKDVYLFLRGGGAPSRILGDRLGGNFFVKYFGNIDGKASAIKTGLVRASKTFSLQQYIYNFSQ